jgi:hypothetical protein
MAAAVAGVRPGVSHPDDHGYTLSNMPKKAKPALLRGGQALVVLNKMPLSCLHPMQSRISLDKLDCLDWGLGIDNELLTTSSGRQVVPIRTLLGVKMAAKYLANWTLVRLSTAPG